MDTCKKTLLSGVVSVFGLLACNNSYDDIQSNKDRTIEVSETSVSDVQSVDRIQTYDIVGGRIAHYLNLQRYNMVYGGNDVETYEISQETTVESADNGDVTLTDSYGNVSVYHLNSMGYAESCDRQEGGGSVRHYTFTYQSSGKLILLSDVSESIDGIGLFSSISIGYRSGTEVYIVHNMNGAVQNYIAATDDGENNTFDVPSLFLAELHPLNLHLPALYGGLLGEPYGKLMSTVEPEDRRYDECTYYTYSDNEAEGTMSCRVQTVSEGIRYTARNITYKITEKL